MNVARAERTATLLPNGMVLVASGIDSAGNISAAAKIYDPVSGKMDRLRKHEQCPAIRAQHC